MGLCLNYLTFVICFLSKILFWVLVTLLSSDVKQRYQNIFFLPQNIISEMNIFKHLKELSMVLCS